MLFFKITGKDTYAPRPESVECDCHLRHWLGGVVVDVLKKVQSGGSKIGERFGLLVIPHDYPHESL